MVSGKERRHKASLRQGGLRMFELIVIWDTGEKEIHEYKTEQDARNAGEGYKMAFGKQIEWYGVRRKING